MYGSAVQDSAQQIAAPVTRCAPGHPGEDGPLDLAAGLIQLSGLVQAAYARVSERHELTPVQARLLCVLIDGPRGMAELAHCFGVAKAALTGLMNRAERRGLAERRPVHGDRRSVEVALTDAGRRAATAFHADVGTELRHLTAHLAPRDREHLRATMADIVTRNDGFAPGD